MSGVSFSVYNKIDFIPRDLLVNKSSKQDIYFWIQEHWGYCPFSHSLIQTNSLRGKITSILGKVTLFSSENTIRWQAKIIEQLRALSQSPSLNLDTALSIEELVCDLEGATHARTFDIFSRHVKNIPQEDFSLDLQSSSFLEAHSLLNKHVFAKKNTSWEEVYFSNGFRLCDVRNRQILRTFCERAVNSYDDPNSFLRVFFSGSQEDLEKRKRIVKNLEGSLDEAHFTVLERQRDAFDEILQSFGTLPQKQQQLQQLSQRLHEEVMRLPPDEIQWLSLKTSRANRALYQETISSLLVKIEENFKQLVLLETFLNSLCAVLDQWLPRFSFNTIELPLSSEWKKNLKTIIYLGVQGALREEHKKWIPEIVWDLMPNLVRGGIVKIITDVVPIPLDPDFVTSYCYAIFSVGIKEANHLILEPYLMRYVEGYVENFHIRSLDYIDKQTPFLKSILDSMGISEGMGQVWLGVSRSNQGLYRIDLYSECLGKKHLKASYEGIPEEFLSREFFYRFLHFEAAPFWDATTSFTPGDFVEFLSSFERYRRPQQPVAQKKFSSFLDVIIDRFHGNLKEEDSQEIAFLFDIETLLDYLQDKKTSRQLRYDIAKARICYQKVVSFQKQIAQRLDEKKISQQQFEVIWATLEEARQKITNIHVSLEQREEVCQNASRLPIFWKQCLDNCLDSWEVDTAHIQTLSKVFDIVFEDEGKEWRETLVKESLESIASRKPKKVSSFFSEWITLQNFEDFCFWIQDLLVQHKQLLFYYATRIAAHYITKGNINLSTLTTTFIEGVVWNYHSEILSMMLPREVCETFEQLTSSLHDVILTSFFNFIVNTFFDRHDLHVWWERFCHFNRFSIPETNSVSFSSLAHPKVEMIEEKTERITHYHLESVNSHFLSSHRVSSQNLRLPWFVETHESFSYDEITLSNIYSFLEDFKKQIFLVKPSEKQHVAVPFSFYFMRKIAFLPLPSREKDSFWSQISDKKRALNLMSDLLHEWVMFSSLILHTPDSRSDLMIVNHYLLGLIDCLARQDSQIDWEECPFVPVNFIRFINLDRNFINPTTYPLIEKICDYFAIKKERVYTDQELESLERSTFFNYNYLKNKKFEKKVLKNSLEGKFYLKISKEESIKKRLDLVWEHHERKKAIESWSQDLVMKVTRIYDVHDSSIKRMESLIKKLPKYLLDDEIIETLFLNNRIQYENEEKPLRFLPDSFHRLRCASIVVNTVFYNEAYHNFNLLFPDNIHIESDNQPHISIGPGYIAQSENFIIDKMSGILNYNAINVLTLPFLFTEVFIHGLNIQSGKFLVTPTYQYVIPEFFDFKGPFTVSCLDLRFFKWELDKIGVGRLDSFRNEHIALSENRKMAKWLTEHREESLLNEKLLQDNFDRIIQQLIASHQDAEVLKYIEYLMPRIDQMPIEQIVTCFKIVVQKISIIEKIVDQNPQFHLLLTSFFSACWKKSLEKRSHQITLSLLSYHVLFFKAYGCRYPDLNPEKLIHSLKKAFNFDDDLKLIEGFCYDRLLFFIEVLHPLEKEGRDSFFSRMLFYLLRGTREYSYRDLADTGGVFLSYYEKLSIYLDDHQDVCEKIVVEFLEEEYGISQENIRVRRESLLFHIQSIETDETILSLNLMQPDFFSPTVWKACENSLSLYLKQSYLKEKEFKFVSFLQEERDRGRCCATYQEKSYCFIIKSNEESRVCVELEKPSWETLPVSFGDVIPFLNAIIRYLPDDLRRKDIDDSDSGFWDDFSFFIRKNEKENEVSDDFVVAYQETREICVWKYRDGNLQVPEEISLTHQNELLPTNFDYCQEEFSCLNTFYPLDKMSFCFEKQELKMGALTFQLKVSQNGVRAYGQSHYTDYFISPHQDRSRIFLKRTLLLENDCGHKKVVIHIESLQDLLFAFSLSAQPYFGDRVFDFIDLILKQSPKEVLKFIEGTLLQDVSSLCCLGLLSFDMNEKGDLQATTLFEMGFLFIYYFLLNKKEKAFSILNEFKMKGCTEEIHSKNIIWVMLSMSLLPFLNDPKEIRSVLELVALYYENRSLYSEDDEITLEKSCDKKGFALLCSGLAYTIQKATSKEVGLEDSKKWMIFLFAHQMFSKTLNVYSEFKPRFKYSENIYQKSFYLLSYAPFSVEALNVWIDLRRKFSSQRHQDLEWVVSCYEALLENEEPQCTIEKWFDSTCQFLVNSPYRLNQLVINQFKTPPPDPLSLRVAKATWKASRYAISNQFELSYLCPLLFNLLEKKALLGEWDGIVSLLQGRMIEEEGYPSLSLVEFTKKELDLRFFDYWRLASGEVPDFLVNQEQRTLFNHKRKEFLSFLKELKGYYGQAANFQIALLRTTAQFPQLITSIKKGILDPLENRILNSTTEGNVISSYDYIFNQEKILEECFLSGFNLFENDCHRWLESFRSKLIAHHASSWDICEFGVSTLTQKGLKMSSQLALSSLQCIPRFMHTVMRYPVILGNSIKYGKKTLKKVSKIATRFIPKIMRRVSKESASVVQVSSFAQKRSYQKFQKDLDTLLHRYLMKHFLFEKDLNSFVIPSLSLMSCNNNDSDLEKVSFEKLEKEFLDYSSRISLEGGIYRIRHKKSLSVLSRNLIKEKKHLQNALSSKKDELDHYLTQLLQMSLTYKEKVDEIIDPKIKKRSFRIDELLQLFFLADHSLYESRLHLKTQNQREVFEDSLFIYLIGATFLQKVDRCLDQIHNVLTHTEDNYDKEVHKLGCLLKEKRVYRFDESDDLFVKGNLLFEYKTGFLLWKTQVVQMEKLLLNKRRAVTLQAIMGSGKTSYMSKLASACLSHGKKVICNVYPSSVAPVHTQELARGMDHIYQRKVIAKSIHRHDFKTLSSLETFYACLVRSLDTHDVFSLTSSDLQSLELCFLTSLADCSYNYQESITLSHDTTARLKSFARILHFMKERVHANFDEKQLVSNPKKEKNFPRGRKKYLTQDAIKTVYHVMRLCLVSPKIMSMIQIDKNQQANLTQDIVKKIMSGLATTVVRSWNEICFEDKQEIIDYILGRLDYIPEFVKEESQKENIGLLKGIFTQILPLCLTSISRVDCGPPKKELSNHEYAVVYDGSESPVPNTIIQDPIEALIKTYMIQAVTPLSHRQVFRLLLLLQKRALKQSEKLTISFSKTKTFTQCRLIWDLELPMTEIGISIILREPEVLSFLSNDSQAKALYVKEFSSRQIFYYPEGIKSNAINLMSMVVSHHGYSGLPKNDKCYYIDSEVLRDEDALGKSLYMLLKSLSNPSSIRVLSQESPKVILEEIFHTFMKEDPHFLALIDSGALLRGVANYQIALWLLDLCQEYRRDIEGIVYHNDTDQIVCLLRNQEVVPLSRCGLSKSQRITIFDDVHTTGADIPQEILAKAVVTYGEKITLETKALQSIFRMRGLENLQQSFVIAIPRYVCERMGVEQPTVEDLIRFAVRNEENQLLELNFKADINKVIDIFRREILNQILEFLVKDKIYPALDLFNDYRDLFVYTTEESFFKLYGGIDSWKGNPLKVINSLKQEYYNRFRDNGIDKKILKDLEKKLAFIGDAQSYPSSIHLYEQDHRPLLHLNQSQEVDLSAHEDLESHEDLQQENLEEKDLDQQLSLEKAALLKDNGKLDPPINFLDHLSLKNLTPLPSRDPRAYSLFSFSQNPLGRPVFTLKDVLKTSQLQDIRSFSDCIPENYFVCNAMSQQVGSSALKILGTKQRRWEYFIAIKKPPGCYPGFDFLFTDTTGMLFWQDKVKLSDSEDPRVGIYSIALGEFIISNFKSSFEVSQRPSIVRARAIGLFLNGHHDYRDRLLRERSISKSKEESKTAFELKKWMKENTIQNIKDVFILINDIHGESHLEGSHIEILFEEAFLEKEEEIFSCEMSQNR